MIRSLLTEAWGILVQLGLQLALGWVFVVAVSCMLRGRSRRWATWMRAARGLVRVAAPAVVVAGIAAALRPEPVTLFLPGLFSLAGAPATAGCALLIVAARHEARGLLLPARRLGRLGGKLMFVGVIAFLVLLGLAFLTLPLAIVDRLANNPTYTFVRLVMGSIFVGFSGFVALLGGLAGKPRPSGYFAAMAYVIGLSTLILAYGQAVEETRRVFPG